MKELLINLENEFQKMMLVEAGESLDRQIFEHVLPWGYHEDINKAPDSERRNYPFVYFDSGTKKSMIIKSSGSSPEFFSPSTDISSAYTIKSYMDMISKKNNQFFFRGPEYNPEPGGVTPVGGKFAKECYYCWVVFSGNPRVVEGLTPSEAICRASIYVILFSAYLENIKTIRSRKEEKIKKESKSLKKPQQKSLKEQFDKHIKDAKKQFGNKNNNPR